MSTRQALRAMALVLMAGALVALFVRGRYGLASGDGTRVATLYRAGDVLARELGGPNNEFEHLAAEARAKDATLVVEQAIGEAPVLTWSDWILGASFVPGKDGIRVTVQGRDTLVTPQELLRLQAYDRGRGAPEIEVALGLDLEIVRRYVAERTGVDAQQVKASASYRRVRFRTRSASIQPPGKSPASLGEAELLQAIEEAGLHLSRLVTSGGHFVYVLDPTTGTNRPGYSWPRHAGATFFLAQAAGITGNAEIGAAARRAGERLQLDTVRACGVGRCASQRPIAELGESALALLAFTELVQTGLAPGLEPELVPMAAYLRSQQRANGDFTHWYDTSKGIPLDFQSLYYSGEAALALARAYPKTKDIRDLDSAERAVEYLTGRGWSFFGSRYYYGEEHWTCQAMAELWPHRPSRQAFDFCARWHAFGRAVTYERGETWFDAEGAYGVGPFITPKLVPAASRSEALARTWEVALTLDPHGGDTATMENQLRTTLALLLRNQFPAGRAHLLKRPDLARGGLPASEVDWLLRIDYTQHMGSALVYTLQAFRARQR